MLALFKVDGLQFDNNLSRYADIVVIFLLTYNMLYAMVKCLESTAIPSLERGGSHFETVGKKFNRCPFHLSRPPSLQNLKKGVFSIMPE